MEVSSSPILSTEYSSSDAAALPSEDLKKLCCLTYASYFPHMLLALACLLNSVDSAYETRTHIRL